MNLLDLIRVARGLEPADLVLSGGRLVNVFSGRVEEVDLAVAEGFIVGLGEYEGRERLDLGGLYVLPGLIEGHLHVESSLLCPAELARAVCPRGTSFIVADPHEIANVLGVAGVEAMLAASADLPVEFGYMAPSCVPATHLETAGASLDARDLAKLGQEPGVLGLAEMMNFPGLLAGDPGVLDKLAAFEGRVKDGHAPLLGGKDLNAYILAGPDSDHECTRLEEAAEKLARGMWIMIREGTSAHNLADLMPLVNPYTMRRCLLVSDDRHPDDLAGKGHLDALLRKAVSLGLDPVSAVSMLSLNPARRFGLTGRGALAPGYQADMVLVEDLKEFRVRQVFKRGRLVAADGRCLHPVETQFPALARSSLHLPELSEDSFRPRVRSKQARVIEVLPGQIISKAGLEAPPERDGRLAADPDRDLALLAVVERHRASGRVGVGLVKGLGLKQGALASSVAHDSHNLIIAGADARSMLCAARRLGRVGGGLCAALGEKVLVCLELPLAGLMSDRPLVEVLADLAELRQAASQLAHSPEPFMSLSFLALPVIPHLKLSDLGLVDVDAFNITDLFVTPTPD